MADLVTDTRGRPITRLLPFPNQTHPFRRIYLARGDWAPDEARVSHTAPGCASLRRTRPRRRLSPHPTAPHLHSLPRSTPCPRPTGRPPPFSPHPAMAAAPTATARASASGTRVGRLAVRVAALPSDGRGDGAAVYKELGKSAFMSLFGYCPVIYTNWCSERKLFFFFVNLRYIFMTGISHLFLSKHSWTAANYEIRYTYGPIFCIPFLFQNSVISIMFRSIESELVLCLH